MRHHLNTLRGFAWAVMLAVLAAAGLTIGAIKPAHAEFEIQESQVEKGEVQIEYRGATHWGLPKGESEAAGDGGDEGEEAAEDDGVLEEEEVEALRQSHDFEVSYGITERILFATTLILEEPIDGDFDLSGVEIEGQYELIEREGNGLGLAFQGGYGFATRGGEADEIEFGPIVELGSGSFLLTLNPLLSAQVGDNRQTDGLGFQYGWRAEQKIANRWGVGVEMFGEIEDLSNTGPFDDQNHSIGPTLFYNPGIDVENVGGLGDDDSDEAAGERDIEFSFNVGLQFGLTDMTSDTALKFQGELEF